MQCTRTGASVAFCWMTSITLSSDDEDDGMPLLSGEDDGMPLLSGEDDGMPLLSGQFRN